MLSRGILTGIAAIFFAAVPASANVAATPEQIRLIDQRGNAFSFKTLQGRPAIVTFIATHCTDACPLINAQFAQLSEALDRRHLDPRLITLTLDPGHDTHRDMVKIANTFNAKPSRWIVASAGTNDMRRLMRAFGVVAEPGRDGYAVAHSTFIYLLDARSRLIKTVLPSSRLTDQLLSEVLTIWPSLARIRR